MDLNKLHKDSELLRVYELFGNNPYPKYGDHQDYFAIHTLDRLFLDFDKSKEAKDIRKIVSPFLSDYTIHPYLMLEKLTDGESKEIIESIFKYVSNSLFSDKKFDREIIKRVEYPELDIKFMKNLLNTMTQERRDERFHDPKKARELFLFYADKQHLGIVLDQLESYSHLYHDAMNEGGGLDPGED